MRTSDGRKPGARPLWGVRATGRVVARSCDGVGLGRGGPGRGTTLVRPFAGWLGRGKVCGRSRGRGVRVAGEILHVVEGYALDEQVGHHHDAERMRRDEGGETGIFEPPLQHRPDGPGTDAGAAQAARRGGGRGTEQGRVLGVAVHVRGDQVCRQPAVEVEAHGNVAVFAAFLPEPQGPALAVVAQVLEPQLRQGAHARAGVGERADDGAVAQADGPRTVDRGQEPSRLRDGDFRRPAAAGAAGLSRAGDGEERVERERVARHQQIAELAHGGQGDLLGGRGAAHAVHVLPGQERGDGAELDVLGLAPVEEVADGAAVGPPGVRVPVARAQKLAGGEARARAGALEHGRVPALQGRRRGRQRYK